MSAPSHGSYAVAKGLKRQANRGFGLTPSGAAARTAAHPSWNATAGVLNGLRRGGRAVEGGGLLNRYTGITRIEGSNPFLSAIT